MPVLSSCGGASAAIPPTPRPWRDGSFRSAATCCTRRCAAAPPSAALRRVGVVAPVLDAEELARIEDLAELQELRSAIAAAPAPLPDAARRPGAVAPLHPGEQVYVAAGSLRGVAWQLSASAYDYGDARAVAVFLSVPGGGGGARCDLATRGSGVGVGPDVLARRLVQTYFDPVANRTWAFGALPSDAREVDVSATAAAATVKSVPADPEAVVKGDLPRGMRVFVAALEGPRDVPAIAARDRSGRVLLTCEEGRRTRPQEESP
jgi:hypothetical protein